MKYLVQPATSVVVPEQRWVVSGIHVSNIDPKNMKPDGYSVTCEIRQFPITPADIRQEIAVGKDCIALAGDFDALTQNIITNKLFPGAVLGGVDVTPEPVPEPVPEPIQIDPMPVEIAPVDTIAAVEAQVEPTP